MRSTINSRLIRVVLRIVEKCEEVPDEPLRKDYFPEEPRSSLLSRFLASVVRYRTLR